MKRAFFVNAAFLALVGSAAAADLPRKMPVKAAPPAPVYDWTGFYVGGYYATGLRQSRAHTNSTNFPGSVDDNKAGWAGGLALGYNYQFAPNWLVGLEGDVGYLASKRSFRDWNDSYEVVGVKTSWLSTVRGRFGYVTGPSLIYATGGAAFTRVEETFGNQSVPPAVHSSTKTGWTVGGGIETKLSRNWTTTTEYLYVDAGTSTFGTRPFALTPDTVTFKHQVHMLKTGFNYKLDGGPFEMFPFFGKPLSSPERWAGLYAGVNLGGGLAVSKLRGGPSVPGEADLNGSGFAGGGQLGYNWIIFSNWVVGVEGDIGYLGVEHSGVEWNEIIDISQKTDWYGTLRGRIGTTTGPALLYLTGGGAFARVRDGLRNVNTGAADVSSRNAAGWTFGGGTEIALDARWSARFEYLYMDLGSTHRSIAGVWDGDFKDRFQVVRAGLSYKFGGPDVITTKY